MRIDMERYNLNVGNFLGIPLIFHWSFLLMFLLLLIVNITLVPLFAALYFIVILHEFGHSYAALKLNCIVENVTMYPFGGVASIYRIRTSRDELLVTLAGPAVNLALIPVLWNFATENSFLEKLAFANNVLFIFNLIPAFPLDGGRIFRSILVMLTGKYYLSTKIAVYFGYFFAIFFLTIGILSFNVFFIAAAFVVFINAREEMKNFKD